MSNLRPPSAFLRQRRQTHLLKGARAHASSIALVQPVSRELKHARVSNENRDTKDGRPTRALS